MSIFTKPPMFPVLQVCNTPIKTPRLTIEGKWKFISKLVKHLIADGWKQISIEANKEFTFTVVELEQ